MSASPPAAMTTTQTSTSTSTEATTIQLQQTPSSTTTAADAPTTEMNNADTDTAARRYDLDKLSAGDALRLLSESLEMLVALTGDVPPTPPPRMPTDPQMSGLQAEKEDLARSRRSSPTRSSTEGPRDSARRLQAYSAAMSAQLAAVQQLEKQQQQQQQQHEAIDGVRLRHPAEAAVAAMVIVDAEPRPLNAQHGAITRKFYSKLEPPISITAYLARLHQFCPMSTAVYLATSLYIHRLAVEQHALPVTRRNAHRLVLAGLRVATKALEDLAYPHAKVARVGGVSEAELARLEISFCFLAGFELVVGHESLHRHWVALSECGYDGGRVGRTGMPTPGEE